MRAEMSTFRSASGMPAFTRTSPNGASPRTSYSTFGTGAISKPFPIDRRRSLSLFGRDF
jgi:hypothetical protein